MSNLSNIGPSVPRTSFSAIVSGGTMTGNRNMGTVQRKALANKNNRLGNAVEEDDFKVRNITTKKSFLCANTNFC